MIFPGLPFGLIWGVPIGLPHHRMELSPDSPVFLALNNLAETVKAQIKEVNTEYKEVKPVLENTFSNTDVWIISILCCVIFSYVGIKYYKNKRVLNGNQIEEQTEMGLLPDEKQTKPRDPNHKRVRNPSPIPHPIVIALILLIISIPAESIPDNTHLLLDIEYGFPCSQMNNATPEELEWCYKLFDRYFT